MRGDHAPYRFCLRRGFCGGRGSLRPGYLDQEEGVRVPALIEKPLMASLLLILSAFPGKAQTVPPSFFALPDTETGVIDQPSILGGFATID